MAMDFKSLSKIEQGALVAGVLSILLSFFGNYIQVSYDGGGAFKGVSAGSNAWTSYATLGVLLTIVATAVVAIRVFASPRLPAGVPWNLVAFAASGLGALLLILRAVTLGGGSLGASVGPGWSGWALFITTIALTVCTALLFKDSGEKLADLKSETT
jgi:hypothetical protein